IARGPAAEIWPEYNGAAGWEGTHVTLDTAKHIYGVDRVSDRVVFRRDDEEAETYAMPPLPDNLDLRLTNESTQPLFAGMMRVRKTVHPYQTVALGTVETNP